jgi:hypothetical protein
MAATTWSVVNMERTLPDGDLPPDGQITTIHWTANLEEQGESAGAYGSVGLGAPDPSAYVPFEDITESQAIGWVKDALGAEQVASIEDALETAIQQKLNPTSAAGVPW